MSICFDGHRWSTVRENFGAWWDHRLDRPLIELVVPNRDAGRPCPDAPLLTQATCADLSIPVEALVDRFDWELSRYTFYGDSFPRVNMDCFGPGVAAAFCGAILDNSIGAVWFHPTDPEIPIEDLHFEYQADNKWLSRIKAFCAAAMERWNGNVLVSMTDLGGNLDILQTFLPGERLLMELYDNPDHVKRLLGEEHELWHRFYSEINAVLQPINPGYSDWSGIYSDTPSFILQCDFSYMIGPTMFEEFALPEIDATTKRLDHTIYHVDGIGQLPHLDMLLALPDLDGIQWVFGDGSPGATEWPEVRRRIADSGKLAQTYGSLQELETIIQQAGGGQGIHHRAWIDGATPDAEIRRELAKFGVPS